jgi:glycosyltransferase involved in cell wall biosynthesis
MPKLVSILPSDLARTRGGGERYAFELHAALGRALPEWSMDAMVAASQDPERHLPAGWKAVGGEGARRLSPGDAIAGHRALRALRGADVVVAHQWRTRASTALRLGASLRRSTRLVSIDHGAGTRLGYALSWLPLPGADLGGHQSEFEASITPIRARAHATIRGGIDDLRFTPAGAGEEAKTDFLMVGRFLPYKGQLRFLECLPDGVSARLIGPSDSEDPDYFGQVKAKASELGVPVELDVSDDELVAAYRSTRYTVQVPIDFRRYEGAAPPELLGLTMLEAMACGSVPICPGTGASAEFVTAGRTGVTYAAGSADALAAALRTAREDRAAHPLLRTGALAEARRWTWDAAVRTLVDALGLGTARNARSPSGAGA